MAEGPPSSPAPSFCGVFRRVAPLAPGWWGSRCVALFCQNLWGQIMQTFVVFGASEP